MSPESNYQPQLIEEIETLLGTPFFNQENDYKIGDYQADEVGFRRFVYQACCRILASARSQERAAASEEPGYETKEWNENWELTIRRLSQIASGHEKDIVSLSRQLALVNNAQTYVDTYWDEIKERLNTDQQIYMMDIMESLNLPPRKVAFTDELGNVDEYIVQGTTIVAPTGFGKTRLIEICTKMFEPGQPLENSSRVSAPTRIVIVSPSLILLDQTADALAAQLPDVRIGRMHSSKKEADADVVFTTIEAFNSNFKDDSLAGNPVSVVMVDEAHHLAEPQFRKTFVTQWRGTSLVFTATPAYDLERDVRAIIPHVVNKTNILKSIEKGTLNDGQILSFFIDSTAYNLLLERYEVHPTSAEKTAIIREVIDTLVLEFATPLLEEGRRGIIFCEPGQEAYWARRMAERINALQLPDGRLPRAEAMHSYANNQLEVIERFREGKLDVITTVDAGREGLDANLDFVIVNCNVVSRLRGHQIVGRGTRLSETFPTTIYGQFSYSIHRAHFEKLYSLEEAFGNDTIVQGKTIRSRLAASRGESGTSSAPVDISAFPDIINELLQRIDRKPLGEAYVGVNRGRRKVVEGLVSLPDMLAGYHATEMRAKKLLRAAGHQWYGRMEGTGELRSMVHYYTPEARDFLHEVLPKGEHLTADEVASVIGVPLAAVRYVLRTHEISGRRVSGGTSGGPPIRYSQEECQQIERIVRTIPGVNPGDRRLREVAYELGLDPTTVWKWSGASDEGRVKLGGIVYMTADEIATVRLKLDNTPMAGPGELHLAAIADRAGAHYQVVERNMTPEDKAAAQIRRYKDGRGFTRITQVWPADKAADIVARMEKFSARPLEAHLLPMSALRAFVRSFSVTPAAKIKHVLKEGGFSAEEVLIEGSRGMSNCLNWQAIRYLQEQLGVSKGKNAIAIDYDRLPSGPDETDPSKIAYAQSIQRRLLAAAQLKKYDIME